MTLTAEKRLGICGAVFLLVTLIAAPGREALGEDHATQSPCYPSDPFTSGGFDPALVVADRAVLGGRLRCHPRALVVEVGGWPKWRSGLDTLSELTQFR
jgi:hypothetical protein